MCFLLFVLGYFIITSALINGGWIAGFSCVIYAAAGHLTTECTRREHFIPIVKSLYLVNGFAEPCQKYCIAVEHSRRPICC